jgi:hypothetical protein
MKLIISILLILASLIQQSSPGSAQQTTIGLFEKNGDIGAVKMAGSVEYDAAKKTYTIAGGGENMWATTDAFHYVW